MPEKIASDFIADALFAMLRKAGNYSYPEMQYK